MYLSDSSFVSVSSASVSLRDVGNPDHFMSRRSVSDSRSLNLGRDKDASLVMAVVAGCRGFWSREAYGGK
jgi:hypothetical protein